MDLILRNAGVFAENSPPRLDIAIEHGRITVMAPSLATDGPAIDLDGRLVAPGLVETHINP